MPSTEPMHRALADARGNRRRVARTARPARQPRRPVAARTARVHRPGLRCPAPQTASRRRPAFAAGRLHLPRRARAIPLYVGTSRNLRARVRQYFVASETRSRMGEMIGLAERVDPIECAHALEAQVRELRLIAAYKPRYNRRSKFPERALWLKLTDEAFPRLSIVRAVRDDGASYLGPAALAAPGRDGARRDPRRGATAPVQRPAVVAPRGPRRVRARRHRPMRCAVRGRHSRR